MHTLTRFAEGQSLDCLLTHTHLHYFTIHEGMATMLSKWLYMRHCLTESPACKSHHSHFLGEEHEALRVWVLSIRGQAKTTARVSGLPPRSPCRQLPSSACLLRWGRC